MRIALSVLVLIFSVSTLASPKVGDKIHRKGTFTSQGSSGTVSMDTEIINYDASTQKFLVRDTITVSDSQPQVTDTLKDASQIASHESIAGILANCSNYGGTRQGQLFLGQTYDSCVVPISDGTCTGTSWIADVPFGSLAIDMSCPNQGIQRLFLPAPAEQGGEFSFAWGT
jgi:hypothetical protein